jgi:protocatechuate 3,4-dioxygenase beta subunit
MSRIHEEDAIVLPDDPSFGTEVQVDYPGYRSTRWRAPDRPLAALPEELHRLDGPVFGEDSIDPLDNDLTRQHEGEPLGERIILHGRVLDGDGRPVPNTLVEMWQANASGRYRHPVDAGAHGPIDPNFSGAGRCLTDDDGRYRFVTIRPGAYPWRNHENAWRATHVHFSLFGPAFATRLITQMYFPGDPLFFQDPIFSAVRDPKARDRLISTFDLEATVPEWALAFRFDIVLRGRDATPMEH